MSAVVSSMISAIVESIPMPAALLGRVVVAGVKRKSSRTAGVLFVEAELSLVGTWVF